MLVEPGLVGALQLSCWVLLDWLRRGYARAVADVDLIGSVEDGGRMGSVLSMPLLLMVVVAHSTD